MNTLARIADQSTMSGGSVWTALGIVALIVLGYALALWLGGRQ